MDGKHKLVIHDFEQISFVNKKTRKNDTFVLAQCEITSEIELSGVRTEKRIVGQLPMPRHLKDVTVGEYLAEFQLSRNRKCQFIGSLFALHKLGDTSAKSASVFSPKRKIKIIDYVTDEYLSFRGEMEKTTFAQCIMSSEVQTETGVTERSLVGKLRMPDHLLNTPPGMYYPDFQLAVDWSVEVGAKLVALRPVDARPVPKQPTSGPKAAPALSA